MDEIRKVLEMLHAHQVTVDEAAELLAALGLAETKASRSAEAPGKPRMIRIVVEADDEHKVRVNVPAALAKFALQLVPKEVRSELEGQGINLAELLSVLDGNLSDGRLVDVTAGDKGTRVLVDVL